MASAAPVQGIQEETMCPICLEYLTDPETMDCGHNFCQGCISNYCDKWGEYGPLECPVCRDPIRKGSLRPNWQLGNIVEKIRQLELNPSKENLCETHQEKLNLFCEEDGEAVCVACWRSPQHRSHRVLLVEEAAQKYKDQIQLHLQSLMKERDEVPAVKLSEEKRLRELLEKMEAERQKIVSVFKQLRQFLEDQERLLLAQLEKLDKEIRKSQDENTTRVSKEIPCLSERIGEMEGMCRQPASKFLQDIRSTLSRCEKGKFQQPVEMSSELEKRLGELSQNNSALTETLKKFKDTLPSELEKRRREALGLHRRVNVTLDPDTAHPELIVSEDWKSARWGFTEEDLPDNPERFDILPCVLGCEGLTSGRHCWEVEIGGGRFWAVGVARESVRRKGWISRNPEVGIWAVERCGDQYQALTSPETCLPLSQAPTRIRVCLDCERGQVTFFDAENQGPIFTFPPAFFTGEKIRPWLQVGRSRFRLWP
ncbi:tripartite motif-containing protein 10-like [Mauremys reevesii]|uniref:tripartite motif-containing protein 10-like n=1 Tax=Mauremys reevesii TaxID=260615 RepID=UPI00193F785F|nr:tripartite motif-containing protein 10-like [Mauremys reevesii]XP_039356281.1 tripartite motif-containing protein 10-like [Mauremys reevesii]